MTIKNSISDVATFAFPTPASTAIAIGDLLFNNSGTMAKASAQTDQGSEVLNQRLFASLFLGVMADQRLSTETDTGDRLVRGDVIVDADCASTTWAVGDLVGAVEDSGGANLENQKVAKVTDASLAIGYCVKAGTSVTTVRCRLISRYTPAQIRAVYWDSGAGDVLYIGSSLPQTVSDGDGTTDLSPNVQILGTTKKTASLLIGSWNTTNDNTVGPTLAFLKSGHAIIGSNTVVASGENLGEILWFGADGTDFESPAAAIRCEVDTTPGAGDMPGRIVFLTTADGGETLTEAMRIASNQLVTFKASIAAGSDATDRVTIKGIYMNPANIAVAVPAITDPDIAKVDINVASAFSMQPAVGDAVIAIPQEAMEANARIQGCYVTNTDQITLVFGSEGGNVTGGNKNFKFLVFDLT